jgi:hypothetical protein
MASRSSNARRPCGTTRGIRCAWDEDSSSALGSASLFLPIPPVLLRYQQNSFRHCSSLKDRLICTIFFDSLGTLLVGTWTQLTGDAQIRGRSWFPNGRRPPCSRAGQSIVGRAGIFPLRRRRRGAPTGNDVRFGRRAVSFPEFDTSADFVGEGGVAPRPLSTRGPSSTVGSPLSRPVAGPSLRARAVWSIGQGTTRSICCSSPGRTRMNCP